LTNVKGSLELGRLPVLEAEGVSIAQSAAIVRYLATKTGLAGSCCREDGSSTFLRRAS